MFFLWNDLFLACLLQLTSLFYVQKTQKQNTTTGLRTCNNILAMSKVRGTVILLL